MTLVKTHISPSWIAFSLWYHTFIRAEIAARVENIETELLAFQFRYQCTLSPEVPVNEPSSPLRQSPEIQSIFRKLARYIHPDFANDAQDALARTELLAKASQALHQGDAVFLHKLLAEHVPQKLTPLEEISALRFQIHQLYTKHHNIITSSTWSLYQLDLEWSSKGRDLLQYLAQNHHEK